MYMLQFLFLLKESCGGFRPTMCEVYYVSIQDEFHQYLRVRLLEETGFLKPVLKDLKDYLLV